MTYGLWMAARWLDELLNESRLGTRVHKARSWLFEQALPLWSQLGVDGDWGFVEHLSLNARPAKVDYKRLRVQARQVYVFSHASLLGYPQGSDVAAGGWRFMLEHGWLRSGGWARRLGRRGGVIDPTLDLYDQSFALLAIAWWIKASGEDVLELADDTLAVIDERLSSPTGVGWLSEDNANAALLQNPHMHLLEALLALHATTGASRFRGRIEEVLEIFDSVLFDQDTGTLAEYYDDKWNRITDERGRIVEPGHHYEWVWLLNRAKHLVPGHDQQADALFEFAEHFGYNPTTGLIYDEVLDDGAVRTPSHRAWPHTEALKAQLARFESSGILDTARTVQILDNLFHHFLRAPKPGAWIDRLDEHSKPCAENIPTSTFYHLFLAFSELLRLEPQLRRAGALE
jgi:mannose/cellobiose epimerase-like protein (N-acyl-D-glucosamine 2-epimerase family)